MACFLGRENPIKVTGISRKLGNNRGHEDQGATKLKANCQTPDARRLPALGSTSLSPSALFFSDSLQVSPSSLTILQIPRGQPLFSNLTGPPGPAHESYFFIPGSKNDCHHQQIPNCKHTHPNCVLGPGLRASCGPSDLILKITLPNKVF